jgi:hypothetical protein
MMERISEHITYGEAIKSQVASRKGIDNTPTNEQLKAMCLLAEKIFEPLRKAMNRPIFISSFFRCPILNEAIGGSSNSQHCKGEAMDLDVDGLNNQIFHWIKNNCVFDQLIWEFGNTSEPDWVHVSYSANVNRKQVLRAISKNGKTFYIPFDL